MPTSTRSLLDVTVVCLAARWRIVARGELDLSSGRDLLRVSAVLADARAAVVDLDLRDVAFVDTAGWMAVGAAARKIEKAGGSFRITAESPAVERFRCLFGDLAAGGRGTRDALATAG